MGKIANAVIVSLFLTQAAGCATKVVEEPGAIPEGYYNAYTNRNAVILYKRPSNKFGCWLAPCGWECRRR